MIFIHIIICSLICTLLFRAFEEGMIFYKFSEFVHKITAYKYLYWIRNPIYNCLVCMCSIWGTIYYMVFIETFSPLNYIMLIMGTGGLNAITEAIIFLSRAVIKLADVVATQIESTEHETISGEGTD